MASITIKANVKPTGGYADTRYWRSGATVNCADHLYANNWNYNVYKSRIVFYIPLSTFKDQTITAGTLKLVMLTPFSSVAKTKPIAVKIRAGGGDNNTSYNEATLFYTIKSYGSSKEYYISLTNEAIAIINNAILAQANGGSINYISIYLGQGGDSPDYGARFVGFNPDSKYSASKPTLSLEYVPSISTGTITTSTPRIGSAINLTVKRNLDTYTHKVEWVINGTTYKTSENISTSDSFTPDISKTNNYLGSSTAVSASAICKISTYSADGVLMGSSEAPFTLHMASTPSITWSTPPSISSTHTDSKKYVSGYSKININAGVVKFNDGSTLAGYRFRMNSCGININTTQTSSNYTTNLLSTNTNANFSVYVSIKDSRGRYSSERVISGLCYSYVSPALISSNIYRAAEQNSSIVDEMGEYLIVKGNYSCTSIGDYNEITKVVVTDITPTPSLTFSAFSDSSYNFSFCSNNKVNSESSYLIKISITDKFSTITVNLPVPEGRYLIHIPRGGKGIGIGTTGEDGYLRLGWPLHLPTDKPLEVSQGGTGVKSYDSLLKNILPEINRSSSPTLNLSGNLCILSDMSTGMVQDGNLIVGNNLTIGSNKITFANGSAVLGYENSDDIAETADFFVECYDSSQEIFFSQSILLNNTKYSNGGGFYSGSDYNVELSSNFKPYAQVAGTADSSYGDYLENGILFATCGQMAQLTGQISPTKKIAAGDIVEICTIPSHLPNSTIIRICQGSTGRIWTLRINGSTGKVTFERYRNGGSNVDCDTGTWLTFHVTWIVI